MVAVDIDIIETVEMVTQVIKCGFGHTQNFCGISHNWLWKWSQKIVTISTANYGLIHSFKSSRIQIEISLVELVTLFWKCMEEVTKVIFDVWNRSQIVFGSVELVTSINVTSGHDHNFFGSVELVTFILVTSGQLLNCYNLIHH